MTSIEQLEKEFYSYAESIGVDSDKWIIHEQVLDKLFEKYKQKHKQEIIDAIEEDIFHSSDKNAEQYYHEKFKKQIT